MAFVRLSSGTKKSNWWIPSDQYVVNYKLHEVANIPPKLDKMRPAIFSGEYNKNNDAKKCTQEAHQVITQAISLCRKSKCGCSKGNCKKGVVDASAKASNVQKRALPMETILQIANTNNDK